MSVCLPSTHLVLGTLIPYVVYLLFHPIAYFWLFKSFLWWESNLSDQLCSTVSTAPLSIHHCCFFYTIWKLNTFQVCLSISLSLRHWFGTIQIKLFLTFFKKWANPGLFFVYFRSFQTNNTSLTTKMWKMSCPSNIWCLDSNPQPSGYESHPITTRPGLPPTILDPTFVT